MVVGCPRGMSRPPLREGLACARTAILDDLMHQRQRARAVLRSAPGVKARRRRIVVVRPRGGGGGSRGSSFRRDVFSLPERAAQLFQARVHAPVVEFRVQVRDRRPCADHVSGHHPALRVRGHAQAAGKQRAYNRRVAHHALFQADAARSHLEVVLQLAHVPHRLIGARAVRDSKALRRLALTRGKRSASSVRWLRHVPAQQARRSRSSPRVAGTHQECRSGAGVPSQRDAAGATRVTLPVHQRRPPTPYPARRKSVQIASPAGARWQDARGAARRDVVTPGGARKAATRTAARSCRSPQHRRRRRRRRRRIPITASSRSTTATRVRLAGGHRHASRTAAPMASATP